MFLGVAENMTEPIPSGGPINGDSTVEPGMAVHKKLFCLLGCFSVASWYSLPPNARESQERRLSERVYMLPHHSRFSRTLARPPWAKRRGCLSSTNRELGKTRLFSFHLYTVMEVITEFACYWNAQWYRFDRRMVLLTPDTIYKSNFNPLSDQHEISLNTIDKVSSVALANDFSPFRSPFRACHAGCQ